jgi:hypothetical protein
MNDCTQISHRSGRHRDGTADERAALLHEAHGRHSVPRWPPGRRGDCNRAGARRSILFALTDPSPFFTLLSSLFAPLSSLYSYESLYSRHSLFSLLPSASTFFSRRFLHSNHNLDARHSSLCFFDILSVALFVHSLRSLSSILFYDLIADLSVW